MPTSSADPDKLQRYSDDGLELVATLKTKSTAVTQAIAALRPSSGTAYVPSLGAADTSLEDLVGDWFHLDEFAGDVARGFRLAGRDPDGDGVYDAADVQIAQQGRVGYADRDQAIAAAQAMARELDRLRNLGRPATPAEVQAFAAMAGRGQHDPAFAVALSRRIGVQGYAAATALIRKAYEGGKVPAAGIAAVQVLATTLSTALDTRPGGGRHDPDNATLPAEERLGAGFVQDLTSGWRPDRDEGVYGVDLSVLLRYTDPPTDVAVAIGNNRLTPLLGEPHVPAIDPSHNPWGPDHESMVVNYATMLNRNQDAAALYLNGRSGTGPDPIALVLDRPGRWDIDGGQALAGLVRNGVTHDGLGGSILDRAIDVVGDLPGIRADAARGDPSPTGHAELPNPYMNQALAEGIAENMDVIARRAAQGNPGPNVQTPLTAEYLATHDFLREVMRDPAAARRVQNGAASYVQDQLPTLPTDPDARLDALQDLGRTVGLADTARTNATIGSAEDRAAAQQAAQQDLARRVESAIGAIPLGRYPNPYGPYTVVAPAERTVGALIVDEGQYERHVDAATDAADEDRTRAINDLGLIVVDQHDLSHINGGKQQVGGPALENRR